MLEIGVIGGPEFILGFQLSGIKKIFGVDSNERDIVEKVFDEEEIGVVIIDDKVVRMLNEALKERIEGSVKPVFVSLSTGRGSQEALRKMIRKSIGVDLWKD